MNSPASRINKLHAYMDVNGIDAMLITAPKHVYYLTGFASEPHERFLGLLLPRGEEAKLLVPALDYEAAQAASGATNIHTHADTDDAHAILRGLMPSGVRCLGVEKEHLTVSRFEAMSGAIGAESYVDIGMQLRDMRAVKAPEEAERMREAVRIVEDVLRAGIGLVKPGVTEIELVAELEYQMKKRGAQGPSFDTLVLAGAKSAMPHGMPDRNVVKEGELLLFDLGVFANGYASDITRTFAVGEITDEMKRIYNAVLAGNLRAVEAVRPGASFGSLDRAARESITAAGYGPQFNHRLGHGLGLDIHEYPSIHGNNGELLREGMTFTIEPGIYVPGIGGVRIEDDVLVTSQGVEVLTRYPKELTVIG
ncbi:M24 family metallopeptidase [Paenibacillus sacheonensis]|uniref:M24 family metallopeptidase n=1 Tax=Paenibacillus sacheonensis TaxID=742054 RepID=A0A7X5C0F5_9BACL|nr:Xaa-Pro peptidase family protein [Paenibacillus sacheonensis]MBM7566884.1 Xaa-Pro dipeptidase [Paenibacillus sacheonensis]NBC71506.1 M24 family metallopeptidase [Paenibacillus sacheonensis]